MPRAHRRLLITLVPALLLMLSALAAQAAPNPPTNFLDEAVISNLSQPVAFAFLPDGRLLVGEKAGKLKLFSQSNETWTLVGTALDITSATCSSGEQGLLGIAVDPQFGTTGNNYLYLYSTTNGSSPCTNGVARYTMSGNTLTFDKQLIAKSPATGTNHNAGDLFFGKDGYLYVSIGDGGCNYLSSSQCQDDNYASRDDNMLLGKVHRITRDGGIPADNPNASAANGVACALTGGAKNGSAWDSTKVCKETFAHGFRNPFRMALDPNSATTKFYVNDVGGGSREEIDNVQIGKDYGWNCREGFEQRRTDQKCAQSGLSFTDPIFDYAHNATGNFQGCVSITGGAFVPNGVWPGYDGAYLFGDYACGQIFSLTANGSGGYTGTSFVTAVGSNTVVQLRFGPYSNTQALYYTNISDGRLRRVRYTGVLPNNPPAVTLTAPANADVNQSVSFSAAGSDPDGNPLTYSWTFGDGGTAGNVTSASHSYSAAGRYTVTVTVSDGKGGTANDTKQIVVGGPRPTIVSPASGATFRVGEVVTMNATATDAGGSDITNAAGVTFTWDVVLYHRWNPNRTAQNGGHTHPFVSGQAGNGITFTAPQPEDLDAASNSFLKVKVTVTDAGGLTGSAEQFFDPKRVNLTFKTTPANLNVNLNGVAVNAGGSGKSVVSWQGYSVTAVAPVQRSGGTSYAFQSWADGGGSSKTIITGAADQTFTAVFKTANSTFLPYSRR